MRDMFYNYDHNIKQRDPIMPPYDMPKKLHACGNVEKLYNVKGDELGVKGKINSKFYLYFNFEGEAIDDEGVMTIPVPLRDALEKSTLYFDVVDQKREVVASFVPELNEFVDEIRVCVYTSEEGPLKYGVYRMHLYFENEEGIYSLFSDEDGILSIE